MHLLKFAQRNKIIPISVPQKVGKKSTILNHVNSNREWLTTGLQLMIQRLYTGKVVWAWM
jgi:hypothetical protein